MSMTNIFLDYPGFIQDDVRTAWANNTQGHYNVNAEFQYRRFSIALPPETVKGKRVVDLGCLIGGAGAWCLANGAASYTGVELQREFTTPAQVNFAKYFPNANWQILEQSFTDFFNTNTESYDIVIGYGITHTDLDVHSLLRNIANLDADVIAMDSKKPPLITKVLPSLGVDPELIEKIDQLSIIELFDFGMLSSGPKRYDHKSPLTTSGALVDIFNSLGYGVYTSYTEELKKYFPDVYSGRYAINFQKGSSSYKNFETVYAEANK